MSHKYQPKLFLHKSTTNNLLRNYVRTYYVYGFDKQNLTTKSLTTYSVHSKTH